MNTLFYTDEYISNIYHNDGVLEFIAGLSKVFYSYISSLILNFLLKKFSKNKSELIKVISMRTKNKKYINEVKQKISQLKIKLIIYLILVFLLGFFFSYYVTVFCAVYRNSQKYWLYGCLGSIAIDILISFIACIFLTLFRYISIKNRIKYCYIISKIIDTLI